MTKLKVLDLFSGVGGFSLGLERTGGFETVAFCEIEEFPRRVLAKHWPDVRCFEDVRKLTRADIDGPVDVICGGYPCQPFSTAGRRQGEKDDRHLWPEVNRLLAEFRPSWFIGENVAGHISMGLDSVLSDLDAQGYSARPFVIPACAVGAPHRRDRVWIIASKDDANADGERPHRTREHQYGSGEPVDRKECESGQIREILAYVGGSGKRRTENVANAFSVGQSRPGEHVVAGSRSEEREGKADNAIPISQPGKWCVEPSVGRVAHGVPDRIHRLKALGNSVVPQIPEMIGRAILEAEKAA